MFAIAVIRDVSQDAIFPLKVYADRNILLVSVTLEVFHVDIFPLKVDAP